MISPLQLHSPVHGSLHPRSLVLVLRPHPALAGHLSPFSPLTHHRGPLTDGVPDVGPQEGQGVVVVAQVVPHPLVGQGSGRLPHPPRCLHK